MESPHKRGDVPFAHSFPREHPQISPQAWGCTYLEGVFDGDVANLPTSVGMYRLL